jgi:prolyl oligopeptidase
MPQTRQRPRYPVAKTVDIIDDFHGVPVRDPFRWLEDADSRDTIAWVDAQNALTRSLLDDPARDAIVTRLERLYDFPRVSVPDKRGTRYFFVRNEGLQNQGVLYVQEGLAAQPRELLDPNRLSPDGTVALTALVPNEDGTLVAYALSKSGSDWQEVFVRDVRSGNDLPDRIRWAKFTTISWLKDGSSFYYVRFPEPGSVAAGEEHYYSKVFVHRLGDPQDEDRLVFERRDDREIVFAADTTSDGRYLVITASKGSSDKSEVYVMPAGDDHARPAPLFTGFASAYAFIEGAGTRLYFRTDDSAPMWRIIAVDLSQQPAAAGAAHRAAFAEVVPERGDRLSMATVVHGTLVTSYLHNASDELRLFDLDGRPEGEIRLPAVGSLSGLSGRPDDEELFFGFSSFTYPPANYRYDFRTRALEEFGASRAPVDPEDYGTKQVWYRSKDGTDVSMFLVHRKGLEPDGRRPVLLFGYGGFNISLRPAFDPGTFVWLDEGGIVAVANLRGGGEYGEAWHQAGMVERKQNVFDDFIAAAAWLIENRYATADTLAIEGGSNGGLLVGAVMVQRPDLAGAVICRVPVADMLRYHLFTVGRFWISEYGSSEDVQQFPYLYKYSPYHNVKDGIAYPATLVMTADTDDRVAPGMAKKFAARLQQATSGSAPILIRVETRAGHGAGKPVSKRIQEEADIYAFLFKYLAVTVDS